MKKIVPEQKTQLETFSFPGQDYKGHPILSISIDAETREEATGKWEKFAQEYIKTLK